MEFSVVIISYNRPNEISRNIREMLKSINLNIEIIIVDNCSEIPVADVIDFGDKRLNVIRMDRNIGVEARNVGVSSASGNIVITIDDDVYGISDSDLFTIRDFFKENPTVSALNFKVIDDVTESQINWCHHRDLNFWGEQEFETYEISEGAVALRRSDFIKAGMYPKDFFISHEGPDLAIALMNLGQSVYYSPRVTVRHAHSKNGRTNWRRYYYDTRNYVWLGIRRYSLGMFVGKVPLHLFAMLVYSLRDGYFKYWCKGFWDSILGVRKEFRSRSAIKISAKLRYKNIERHNLGFLAKVQRRLFKKEVSI